jgi:hypothetical protein
MMTNNVPTSALSVGDIVHVHGCRFRLIHPREIADQSGAVVAWAFSTQYVGPVTPDRDPVAEYGFSYGLDMVEGRWVIQGSRHTLWQVDEFGIASL